MAPNSPVHVSRRLTLVALTALLVPVAGATAKPCRTDPATLCLAHGRLRATVTWDAGAAPQAHALGDTAGELSGDGGTTWLVVKAIDGRAVNGHFWLLQSASPGMTYHLTLEDLETGATRTYVERAGDEDGSDLFALRDRFVQAGGRVGIPDPTASAGAAGPVTVAAREAGVALDAEALDGETTVFRRPGARDPALVASILDGRETNGHWWLLAAAPEGGRFELAVRGDDDARSLIFDASEPATVLFDRAAAARSLKVTLDAARAVQKSIGTDGGSLQATAANGALFTLTIPAQALLFPETITLTPIKSIQGLPLTPGLAAGVEVGPPGLRFSALASLAIRAPQPVTLAAETTFGYRLAGKEFFLYPAEIGQRPVRLDILHTGGFGLASGKASEQKAQLGHKPPRAEDQFDQALWQAHWQLRQSLHAALLDPVVGQAGTGLLGFYQSEYTSAIQNQITLISGSCDGRKKWGPLARNFIAKATADGVSSQIAARLEALQQALAQGSAKCYDQYTGACRGFDHTAPVPALQWWNDLASLGATSLVDSGKLSSCLTFQLEFKTTLGHRNPAHDVHGDYIIAAVHKFDTKIDIHFQPPFRSGVGPPTLNVYTSVQWTGTAPQGCTINATGQKIPDVFSVPSLLLDANAFEDNPPPPKLDMSYSTGDPQAQINETCEGKSELKFAGLFGPAYLFLHIPNLRRDPNNPLGTFGLTDWVVTEDQPWATRHYQDSHSLGNINATEDTMFRLLHVPGLVGPREAN